MSQTAFLILENGVIFEGEYFGKQGEITGELVFTTGMTGYLETLTDPSYYGQTVVQTFPLIGNYGVIPADFESGSAGPAAYIVKHPCQDPSNFRSEGSLDTFLKTRDIVGLCNIDTRALTRIIRDYGVLNGKITPNRPTETDRAEAAAYKITNAVASASQRIIVKYSQSPLPKLKPGLQEKRRRVAVMDFGAKRGITEALIARECEVWLFPYDSAPEVIFSVNPAGIMLSNGPGDPAEPANNSIIETIRELYQSGVPIFGICLGHQLLALANGFSTKKLKFGHRGANQPVMDTQTGRIYVTSQNHGFAVVAEEVSGVRQSFVNVNDGTCEGLDYGKSFSVQFHPEARGGPLDTIYLFDEFIKRMT